MASAGLLHAISERAKRLSISTVVSLVLGTGYFVASRGVRNLFPFTTLDMYAHTGQTSATRIFAVDASGRMHQVTSFDAWSCDKPLDTSQAACPEMSRFDHIDYVSRDIAQHVDEHKGDDPRAEPVRLVRRVWRLDDRTGPPPSEDCTLATCRARLR